MRIVRRAVILTVVAFVASGCAGSDAASSASGETDFTSTAAPTECRDEATGPTTYRYIERDGVDSERNSLDVYLPAGCGPVPVVMWVHGGGWRGGDKAQGFVERKAQWAASLGFALIATNYRLSSPEVDVRWPDHGDDVAAAVAWVQQDGWALGLDTTDLTLLGHSAGAHLVAILGTDPSLLRGAGAEPAGVRCVAALDFSSDLATSPASDLIADAFGDDPEVLAAASPIVQVERNGAPAARFLVGTRGGPQRVTDAQTFVDAINTKGGSAELLNANPYTHNQISSQLGAEGESLVTSAISEFVRSCAQGT